MGSRSQAGSALYSVYATYCVDVSPATAQS
jgi:hypothetical protein